MGSGRVDFLRRCKSLEVHFIILFLATAAESVMYRFIAIYNYGSVERIPHSTNSNLQNRPAFFLTSTPFKDPPTVSPTSLAPKACSSTSDSA